MADSTAPTTAKAPVRLQDGEMVIQVVRQHAWFIMGKIILSLLIFIGFAILLNLASRPGGIPSTPWAPWVFLIGLIITLLICFSFWYGYRNNLWAITNQRLIDSTKKVPWHQTLSTADLVNVQDVNVVISGIAASIFKFGDVNVQTSSNSLGMVLKGVQDPEQVLTTVDRARDAARREQFRSIGAAMSQGQG
jgi:hypothetical protein